MTLWEISDFIEAESIKQKDNIYHLFLSAQATASRVNYHFSDVKTRKESDILQPWDVYPELFKEERDAYIKAQRQVELSGMVSKRTERMMAINKARSGKTEAL